MGRYLSQFINFISNQNKVFAYWFSGEITIPLVEPENDITGSMNKKYESLRFKEGYIVERRIISNEEETREEPQSKKKKIFLFNKKLR